MTMATAESHPYLSEGIIAYIGNKRRLLGLIGEAVSRAAGQSSLSGLRFADPFSGSGIVSRYARFMGMQVTANDWEPYAEALARAWLQPRPGDILRLFGTGSGLEDAITAFNNLPDPNSEDTYLARYYAPSTHHLEDADYRRERLFYTRQNALRLDAARNQLESMELPEGLGAEDMILRHSLLLAPLVYAAATNVNTSGVFKAYHRGFGGHGRDALGRITAPIRFRAPRIIDAPAGRVFAMDAAELAAGGMMDDSDIVYLDPPYNQHQYGSNYHLLNTIVRWDRIPEPLDIGTDGTLLRKAGIRPDWTETRSAYCSKKTAEAAFGALLESLKAPMLLISYSTDGIIPFHRLRSICEGYGRLSLMANPYVTYRGGRQSVSRRDANLEFILIVERGRSTGRADRDRLDALLARRRLQLAGADFYRPDMLRQLGRVDGRFWKPVLPGGEITLATSHLARIEEIPEPENLSAGDVRALSELLSRARCRSRDEELTVIEQIWQENPGECSGLLKQAPRILRKMAHRKYRREYEDHLKTLKDLGRRHEDDFLMIADSLEKVERIAERRFAV